MGRGFVPLPTTCYQGMSHGMADQLLTNDTASTCPCWTLCGMWRRLARSNQGQRWRIAVIMVKLPGSGYWLCDRRWAGHGGFSLWDWSYQLLYWRRTWWCVRAGGPGHGSAVLRWWSSAEWTSWRLHRGQLAALVHSPASWIYKRSASDWEFVSATDALINTPVFLPNADSDCNVGMAGISNQRITVQKFWNAASLLVFP